MTVLYLLSTATEGLTMAYMKMVGGWLHYRNDPAHASSTGYIPLDKIVGMEYAGDGSNYIHIYAGTCSFLIENTTLEEVMSLIRSETDRSSIEVMTQQAERIAELERLLEEAREDAP